MNTRLKWSLAVCLVVAVGTFAARKISLETISELEQARATLDARELPREAAIAYASSPRSVTTDGTGIARRDTAVGRSGRRDDADRRAV